MASEQQSLGDNPSDMYSKMTARSSSRLSRAISAEMHWIARLATEGSLYFYMLISRPPFNVELEGIWVQIGLMISPSLLEKNSLAFGGTAGVCMSYPIKLLIF